MKNRTRSIESLKREICHLEGKIKFYCKEKPAFSKRLGMILERKARCLLSLIKNQEK